MKAIPGYAGYFADIDGTIWSALSGKLKPLKPQFHGRYLKVSVQRNKQSKFEYIHRLVLLAYVGPCPPGWETDHKNHDRYDNRLENLHYVSHKENCDRAWKTKQERIKKFGKYGTTDTNYKKRIDKET